MSTKTKTRDEASESSQGETLSDYMAEAQAVVDGAENPAPVDPEIARLQAELESAKRLYKATMKAFRKAKKEKVARSSDQSERILMNRIETDLPAILKDVQTEIGRNVQQVSIKAERQTSGEFSIKVKAVKIWLRDPKPVDYDLATPVADQADNLDN